MSLEHQMQTCRSSAAHLLYQLPHLHPDCRCSIDRGGDDNSRLRRAVLPGCPVLHCTHDSICSAAVALATGADSRRGLLSCVRGTAPRPEQGQ